MRTGSVLFLSLAFASPALAAGDCVYAGNPALYVACIYDELQDVEDNALAAIATLQAELDAADATIAGLEAELAGARAAVASLEGRLDGLAPAGPLVVFVTEDAYAGLYVPGVAGADTICQADADEAGLSGTFRAWLGSADETVATKLTRSNDGYVLVDGTVVADDWEDLTDGTLDHGIDLSARGALQSGNVWTGTTADGLRALDDGDDCERWIEPFGAFDIQARVGHIGATDATWTDAELLGCSPAKRLYCFQQ